MIDGIERIGIYGGTFDPIHNGHKRAAEAFLEQMKLDLLFVIPTAVPPHKSAQPCDDPAHRLCMCELAFEDNERIIVSDLEIRRGGKSYTVDTLRAMSAPDRRLFLLCGTDMVLTFDKWYCFEEIFKLCYPIYVRREKDALLDNKVVSKITEYYQKYGVMFRKVVTDAIELSSTELREAVRKGEDISDRVPLLVAEYIKQNKLYL